MNRLEARQEIARYIREHPEKTFRVISNELGVGLQTLAAIAKENGLSRPKTLARLKLKQTKTEKI